MMGIRGGTINQDPSSALYDPYNPMAMTPNIASIRSQAMAQNNRMGAMTMGPGYQMPQAPQNTWNNQPIWNSQSQQNQVWQRPAYMPQAQQPTTYQQAPVQFNNNTSGIPMKSGW
jgi:hypothetical protein